MDASAILTSKLEKMHLDLDTKEASKAKSKKTRAVADSWEDEGVSSGADDEPRTPTVATKPDILAPPPTPMMVTSFGRPFAPIAPTFEEDEDDNGAVSPRSDKMHLKRPDKTDAVARRMIASALGVKVPPMTDEQEAYDKALGEKEGKPKAQDRETAKRQEDEAAMAR